MTNRVMRRGFVLVFLTLGSIAGASPQMAGMLGQSGGVDGVFVDWCVCGWCTSDAAANVYLPGGLMVRAGTTVPMRMERPVRGALLFDGNQMFEWYRQDLTLYGLDAVPGGFARDGRTWKLPSWESVPAIAPKGVVKGAAGRFRVVALDPKRSQVVGWKDNGMFVGTVVDFSKESWAGQATGVAFDPQSGDILLCTRWEVRKVFRFDADGREVREKGKWPASAFAIRIVNERGRLWGVGNNANQFGRKLRDDEVRSFGEFAHEVYGIAWGGNGYWLATTQGAQYYPAADPQRCQRRIGGMPGVTALAVAKGRVLAVAGVRMFDLWLDDHADERLSSDMTLTFANRWSGRVTGIDVDGEKFVMHDAESGENWTYDPAVTQWAMRDRRMFKSDASVAATAAETQLGKGRAVAEATEIVVYSADGRRLATIPEKATALASAGRWLLAYVPAKAAILKYRF